MRKKSELERQGKTRSAPASVKEAQLQGEVDKCMSLLKCSTCSLNLRTTVLTKCMHSKFPLLIRLINGLLTLHQRFASSVWMLEYPQDSESVQHATSHSGKGTFSSFTSSDLVVVFAFVYLISPCALSGIPGRTLFYFIRAPSPLVDYSYYFMRLYCTVLRTIRIGIAQITPCKLC